MTLKNFKTFFYLFAAENISKKYNISRLEQDEFATSSQNKAEEALKLGYFDKEMTPVEISARTPTIVTVDEFPKSGTTVERLSKLKPVFDKVLKLTFLPNLINNIML